MKESLAAGLLMEAGYHKLIEAAKSDGLPAVLIDPMAGSATFCLEAAFMAADYAPGLMRMKYYESDGEISSRNPHQDPPVARWKGSDAKQWKEMVKDARDRAETGLKRIRAGNSNYSGTSNCVIKGNEYSAASLALANIEKAGLRDVITIDEGDCIDWDLGGDQEDASPTKIVIPGRTIVACNNPPWGLRLSEDIEESWTSLKSFFREQCNSSEAWVLSGSKETTTFLRMKKSRSVVIKTADEDLRWIQYHVFRKKPADFDQPMEMEKQRKSKGPDRFY